MLCKWREKIAIRRLEVRPARRAHAINDMQHEKMTQIRNFLTHTRWQEGPDPTGAAGITWLELYLWFLSHSNKKEKPKGVERLLPKSNLQKELAAFVKATRSLATQSFEEHDEWLIKPCRSPENRLRALAVANRQAGIQGMPAIGFEDVRLIADSVLMVRGSFQTRQTDAKAKGTLRLKFKSMNYKSVADLKNDGTHADMDGRAGIQR